MGEKEPKLAKKPEYRRNSKLTDELLAEVMDRISNGELLSGIFRGDPRFPAKGCFHRCLRHEEYWRQQYTEARVDQMHCFADEVVEISQDSSKDVLSVPIYGKDGELKRVEQRSDNTAVNRHKLEVTTKLFLMSRLAGRHYAEKQQMEHSGQVKIIPVLRYGMESGGSRGLTEGGKGEPRVSGGGDKSLAASEASDRDESD